MSNMIKCGFCGKEIDPEEREDWEPTVWFTLYVSASACCECWPKLDTYPPGHEVYNDPESKGWDGPILRTLPAIVHPVES